MCPASTVNLGDMYPLMVFGYWCSGLWMFHSKWTQTMTNRCFLGGMGWLVHALICFGGGCMYHDTIPGSFRWINSRPIILLWFSQQRRPTASSVYVCSCHSLFWWDKRNFAAKYRFIANDHLSSGYWTDTRCMNLAAQRCLNNYTLFRHTLIFSCPPTMPISV